MFKFDQRFGNKATRIETGVYDVFRWKTNPDVDVKQEWWHLVGEFVTEPDIYRGPIQHMLAWTALMVRGVDIGAITQEAAQQWTQQVASVLQECSEDGQVLRRGKGKVQWESC